MKLDPIEASITVVANFKRTLFLIGLLLFVCQSQGQQLPQVCIDINKIPLFDTIRHETQQAFLPAGADLNKAYQTIQFEDLPYKKRKLQAYSVSNTVLLRFRVCNQSDSSSSVYFFPGFYFTEVKLYRAEGSSIKALPTSLPDIRDSSGYHCIRLAAHDSALIIAALKPLKTYINIVHPRLINPGFLTSFVEIISMEQRSPMDMISYIFSGLMFMMILFSIVNFSVRGNYEFVYYSGYAFFLAIMFITKYYYFNRNNEVNYFFESYFDFILQGLGHGCYMIFMQHFLQTKRSHPFLHHLYNAGFAFVIAVLLAYSFFHFFGNDYIIEYSIETYSKVVLLGLNIVFLVYALRKWHDPLFRFMFWGNFSVFVFSFASFAIIQVRHAMAWKMPGVLEVSMFYYEAGIIVELLFFLMGLNYKNRRQIIRETRERERLKAENQMKEYEKELAVYKAQQEERNRISADMHDELGSGMTAIRLMSEIAKNKMKENVPTEIEKISTSSDDLLNKMNAIIWSMNSGNDTVDNLVSYIRAYSLEYFENMPIICRVVTPDDIPKIDLNGDKRRNIFLCVKETLNNAVKHSQANLLEIKVEVSDALRIDIYDDGVGVDLENLRQFGNGLTNIKRRMESIGGKFSIENRNKPSGTHTQLTLPLH